MRALSGQHPAITDVGWIGSTKIVVEFGSVVFAIKMTRNVNGCPITRCIENASIILQDVIEPILLFPLKKKRATKPRKRVGQMVGYDFLSASEKLNGIFF